ncbi:hypothetical protein RJ639_043577 [Escallonia herrerae]|uniref:K-box domain-containing protein n=1 Tax=Escallonia herrerae TaxID=1293975 RepID=A0AA89B3D0_9ASTE|nr:hypothetical protein RJ639_043577 [Escallonia herrerae]
MLTLLPLPALTFSLCHTSCNNIPINYPFGVDDGCGAPQYCKMLNCSTNLPFITPSGTYEVQGIDYNKKTPTIYDPSMSTCPILQPHHDFDMSEIKSVIIPPAPNTVFTLLNCSRDSSVLNHYRSLCFNFSGHSCDELYDSCISFRLFHLLSNNTPPCCFTGYDTVKYMSMNILDCTHYMTVYNTDGLLGVAPLDWIYGIKLSYSVPDTGCDRCGRSGGTCGFDENVSNELIRMKTETDDLELSLQQCNGQDMSSMRLKDLDELEQQIESSLEKVRTRKVMFLFLVLISQFLLFTSEDLQFLLERCMNYQSFVV